MNTEAQILPNCRNVPKSTATPSKLPIQPKLPTICDLIMQNEPNFRKSQMNVTIEMKKDYEKKDTWWSGKNEPKTNPIKANLLNAQMNVNKVLTKDYENIPNLTLFENKPKLVAAQPLAKPDQTQFQTQRHDGAAPEFLLYSI